jgi:hypothetical protein
MTNTLSPANQRHPEPKVFTQMSGTVALIVCGNGH